MSNTKYEQVYFNEDIKNEFMSNYNEGARKSFDRIFKVSHGLESDLGKDLYNFNREEIRQLLFLFSPKKLNSSKASGRLISLYIEWSIGKGLKKTLNPLDGVTKDWHEQFVNEGVKLFWTYDEIKSIVHKLHNAQDAVIPLLIFEGCLGKSNSELVNLKISDIDQDNNLLHLLDGEERRTIVVDDLCIKMCLAAHREFEYEKRNGNGSPDIRSPFVKLVDSNHILKSALTRTEHFDEAASHLVLRRLDMISDEIGDRITTQSILNSGMIYMAKKLYDQNGRLEDEEYELIFKKFAVSNPYRLKVEFLNLDKIKELYGSS